MSTRFNKVHPALKYAGYSATTLLPGEDSAAFETLHRAPIDGIDPAVEREGYRAAEEQARQELGDIYKFRDPGAMHNPFS